MRRPAGRSARWPVAWHHASSHSAAWPPQPRSPPSGLRPEPPPAPPTSPTSSRDRLLSTRRHEEIRRVLAVVRCLDPRRAPRRGREANLVDLAVEDRFPGLTIPYRHVVGRVRD